jgi:hypothetical protein
VEVLKHQVIIALRRVFLITPHECPRVLSIWVKLQHLECLAIATALHMPQVKVVEQTMNLDPLLTKTVELI